MRYLAFDIECAQSYGNYTPICNIGYVIYDEQLNLIEKKDILINPRASFKLEGRTNREDIKLFHSVDEYKSAPNFAETYSTIKLLLEESNQIILNHAVNNDIIFIYNDCMRYKLPMIDFAAYDTTEVYKSYTNSRRSLSLDKLIDSYQISSDFNHHRADEDADAAMKYMIEISKRMEVNPIDMIELASMKPYNSLELIGSLSKKNQKKDTMNKCKKKPIKYDYFKQKKIAFAYSLEDDYEKYESILSSIYEFGGVYSSAVSLADIFIYEEDKTCNRCKSYEIAISQGIQVEGITYHQFIKTLEQVLFDYINS